MTASVDTDPVAVVTEARSMQRALLDWLVNDAYPLWATAGVDASTGAFVESLDEDGRPLAEPRRARVQPRQVYAFAHG
jgi:mannose/cellobiose epimerase-like protein (N-acyl-D-glucosamine 2-epimerase family)